jgi:hypothetical protein
VHVPLNISCHSFTVRYEGNDDESNDHADAVVDDNDDNDDDGFNGTDACSVV